MDDLNPYPDRLINCTPDQDDGGAPLSFTVPDLSPPGGAPPSFHPSGPPAPLDSNSQDRVPMPVIPVDMSLVDPILTKLNESGNKLGISVAEIILATKIMDAVKRDGDNYKADYKEIVGMTQNIVDGTYAPIPELAFKPIEDGSGEKKSWEHYQKLGGDPKVHKQVPVSEFIHFDGSRLPKFVGVDDPDFPGYLLKGNAASNAYEPINHPPLVKWQDFSKVLDEKNAENAAKFKDENRQFIEEVEAAAEFDSDDDDTFMTGKAYLPGGKKHALKYSPTKFTSVAEEEAVVPQGYTTTGRPWVQKPVISPRKHMLSQTRGFPGQAYQEYQLPGGAVRAHNSGPNNNWGYDTSSELSQSSGGAVGLRGNEGYPPPLHDENGFLYNNGAGLRGGRISNRSYIPNATQGSFNGNEHINMGMSMGMGINNGMGSGMSNGMGNGMNGGIGMNSYAPGQHQIQNNNTMPGTSSNTNYDPFGGNLNTRAQDAPHNVYQGFFDRQLSNLQYSHSPRGVSRHENMMIGTSTDFQNDGFGGFGDLAISDVTPKKTSRFHSRDNSDNEITPRPKKNYNLATIPTTNSYGQYGNSLRLVNKPAPRTQLQSVIPSKTNTTSLRADSPAYIPRGASPIDGMADSPLAFQPRASSPEEVAQGKPVPPIGAPRFPSGHHRTQSRTQRGPSAKIALGAFMSSKNEPTPSKGKGRDQSQSEI